MARFRKPFFKKSHAAWYVQIDGKQIRLDEDKGKAFDRFHEIMSLKKQSERFQPASEPIVTLGSIADQFIGSAFQGKSPSTRSIYEQKLLPFVDHLGREFPAVELKPFHVDQWIASHPKWSSGSARICWRTIQRLYRWAHRRGILPEHPIVHQEKPKGGRREVVIGKADFDTILSFVRNEQFRLLLILAWETGSRPQELVRAQGRHFDTANRRLVFSPHESKDRGHSRVVYLTDTAWQLLQSKIDTPPSASLLTNSEGIGWTTDAVNCAFRALQKRMTQAGVPTRKYCLYHFRHSWLDRMLKKGVDALTCAILMGHRDPSMVARTYQHLSQSPDYLRAALNKAAG